jgi:hypothetical protein
VLADATGMGAAVSMQASMFTPAGELPVLGRVVLHFGDWREAAESWPADAVAIFDPPYGIGYKSAWTSYRRGWQRKVEGIERGLADSIIGDESTLERDDVLARGWSAAAVFGPARLDRVPPWGDPRAVLVWDKGEGVGMGDLEFPWRPNFETVAIYGTGWAGKRTTSVLQGRVLAFGRQGAVNGRQHPHEKPLGVMAELIGKAPSGFSIVDPFAGSGTTLLAAALLGRDAWGAEIDPQYREVILGRLAAEGIEVEVR